MFELGLASITECSPVQYSMDNNVQQLGQLAKKEMTAGQRIGLLLLMGGDVPATGVSVSSRVDASVRLVYVCPVSRVSFVVVVSLLDRMRLVEVGFENCLRLVVVGFENCLRLVDVDR